jgi:hypothetical protein
MARWTYRVVAVDPGPPVKISATPAGASPYGDLANIKLWPGPSGGYATPLPGSLVTIRFNDGDPAQAAVDGLDPDSFPTSIKLGGPAPLPGALAPPLVVLMGAHSTWVAALQTYTLAIQTIADPSNTATPTLTTANGVLEAALATAETATPSLVTSFQ